MYASNPIKINEPLADPKLEALAREIQGQFKAHAPKLKYIRHAVRVAADKLTTPKKSKSKRPSIEDRFKTYHFQYPEVYDELVRLARFYQRQGTYFSIALLFEELRCKSYILPKVNGSHVLPNEFRSRYARLIMQQELDLDGAFEVRRLQAA